MFTQQTNLHYIGVQHQTVSTHPVGNGSHTFMKIVSTVGRSCQHRFNKLDGMCIWYQREPERFHHISQWLYINVKQCGTQGRALRNAKLQGSLSRWKGGDITWKVGLLKKEVNQVHALPCTPIYCSHHRSTSWDTISKTELKSSRIRAAEPPSSTVCRSHSKRSRFRAVSRSKPILRRV